MITQVKIFLSILSLAIICTCIPYIRARAPKVTIVGTAHGKHLLGNYPVFIFDDILARNPVDLILIEVSEDMRGDDNWSESTPEMALIAYYGKDKNIPVKGIDLSELQKQDLKKLEDKQLNSTDKSEIKKTHVQLHETTEKYSFESINNQATMDKLKALSKDIAFKNPVTERRNKLIAKNILSEIRQHKAKHVLVFTGYKHRFALAKNLRLRVRLKSPLILNLPSAENYEEKKIPLDVLNTWTQNIERMSETSPTNTDNDKAEKKLALFKDYLAYFGK